MCLTLKKREKYLNRAEAIIAFKCFLDWGGGRLGHMYYRGKGKARDGYRAGVCYEAHKVKVNVGLYPAEPIKYHAGFHCFRKRGDARKCYDWPAMPVVVRKVKIWGQVTWGYQGGYPAIVGQFMEILET